MPSKLLSITLRFALTARFTRIVDVHAIYEIDQEKAKAEPLFLRAIALDEKASGPDSPDVATDLNNLGYLYVFTKRYQEASKAFEHALTIRKKAYGDSDPLVKESENGLEIAKRGLQQSALAK